MSAINEIQDKINDEFSLLDGDLEMSNFYLIELGEKLPPLPDKYRVDENLVKGCQSKVWLYPEMTDGKIHFHADSNTAITKGLVSLLVRVLSDQTPEDIVNADLYFIDRIGLNRFVGTQRSNGFASMIKQIKLDAFALKTKMESNA
jgi:cysteine desulfuration protein SufE